MHKGYIPWVFTDYYTGLALFVAIILIVGEKLLLDEADCRPPHKIDENMWKNREHIEEIIFLLERPHWPPLVRIRCIFTRAPYSSREMASYLLGVS